MPAARADLSRTQSFALRRRQEQRIARTVVSYKYNCRPAITAWMLVLLTVLLSIGTRDIIGTGVAARSSPKTPHSSVQYEKPSFPPSVQFYVHALTSSATYATSASDPSLTGSFGQTAVFDYNITSGLDAASSRQLGSIRGFEVYNSLNPASVSILVLNTVTYDDGTYNGTFCLHGQGNIDLTSYDIPVVGGTGSFRGASGYSHVTNLRTPGNDHVFQHVLHFFRPS